MSAAEVSTPVVMTPVERINRMANYLYWKMGWSGSDATTQAACNVLGKSGELWPYPSARDDESTVAYLERIGVSL